MKDGAVGFYSSAFRKLRNVDKDRGLVKQLEKTRTESHPDLRREKMGFEKRVRCRHSLLTQLPPAPAPAMLHHPGCACCRSLRLPSNDDQSQTAPLPRPAYDGCVCRSHR